MANISMRQCRSITQNGIAVYRFTDGQVLPERFITIPAQRLAPGKTVTYDTGGTPEGTAPPYPAGFAVLASSNGDRLLVANNLSDNVVLLDVNSGQVLTSFDVSASKYIPAAYPYTVVANQAGTKAWVSLWNASAVAELDLNKGEVTRRIELWHPSDPVASGTHPTTMLLSRNEDILYVAMANAATAQGGWRRGRGCEEWRGTTLLPYCSQQGRAAGAAPIAIALSPDENHLYAASASLNAVAVFDTKRDGQTSDSMPWNRPLASSLRNGIPAPSPLQETICSSPVPRAKAAGQIIWKQRCRLDCILTLILTSPH